MLLGKRDVAKPNKLLLDRQGVNTANGAELVMHTDILCMIPVLDVQAVQDCKKNLAGQKYLWIGENIVYFVAGNSSIS